MEIHSRQSYSFETQLHFSEYSHHCILVNNNIVIESSSIIAVVTSATDDNRFTGEIKNLN